MTLRISVNNLGIRTRSTGQTLLEPLSFDVVPGRPLCILGESGAGKSLIAQALLGNLPAELSAHGEMHFNGTDWMKEPPARRRRLWGKTLALLPQEPTLALNPLRTAADQLTEGYRRVRSLPSRKSRALARRAFRQLGLLGAERKRPGELSGGMAQRLVFACTTAGGARVLIADEPTKGLDVDRRGQVIEQLKGFVNERSLLIVITHDIEVVRAIGGRTLVLKQGELQEEGDTRARLSAPASGYARRLIAAAPSQWAPTVHPSSAAAETVVRVDSLAMSRAGAPLFSDLSFTLKRGQIVGVSGPSGSGKSTLGDILLGLLPPDTGTVERPPGWQRHRFLKLYQDPPGSISPHWTLNRLLWDLLRRHRIDPAKVAPLQARLGLSDALLQRRSGDVSGGELQRFSILRALLLDPLFLFADEPTSRLDPITQRETIDLLCEAARQTGCGLLLVSHDRTLLEKRCDGLIELPRATNRSRPEALAS